MRAFSYLRRFRIYAQLVEFSKESYYINRKSIWRIPALTIDITLTEPQLRWILIGYILYHTVGYLILSPILWVEKGPFRTILLFIPCFIPGVKTFIKLSNWGLTSILKEVFYAVWLGLLPFAVAEFLFPGTPPWIFAAAFLLFLGLIVIAVLGFSAYYNFSIFRAVFFPTEEELNDPINFLYDDENIRSDLLNRILSDLSQSGITKEDAVEMIETSELLAKPRIRPFEDSEKMAIRDFLLEYLKFNETEK